MITFDHTSKSYGGTPAITDLQLNIPRGELLVLIGPSGSGKSTALKMVNRMVDHDGGRILLDGQEIYSFDVLDLRRRMGYAIQSVGLFPHWTVARNIATVPQLLGWSAERIDARVTELLTLFAMEPAQYRNRLPHQLSGGQRQRVGIARALMVSPKFLVCDEPVAALDVSIQAQVINLFMDLRAQHGLTYLFISHDLGVVRHISDRVAIMYLGKIVEIASTADIFSRANHPYTQALIAEVPNLERRKRVFVPIQGEIPSPLTPPPGCTFHPRCPHAMQRCREEVPALEAIAPGHWSACHLNHTPA